MKILIVSQCFYPDIYAINDTVRILTERGHQVTVLTGLPDYRTGRIPTEYRYGHNARQRLFSADIIRVKTIARRKGPLFRSLNYLSFAVTGSLRALFGRWPDFDVIYVWQVSPVTMAIPAICLKKRFHKPLFLYCMDIWPECVKAMGFKEEMFLYRIIAAWSRKIYAGCDRIAVSSRPFLDYLEQTDKVDPGKMSYLPQYAKEEIWNMNLVKKPGNHTDLLYVGNIGKAQDMACLIRAIAKLADRNDVTFHIIGSGTMYEESVRLASVCGADRIMRFYGPMSYEDSISYYAKADACVLCLDGSNRIGETLPGKLQTYMAAGKPVIAAMNGAGREVIQESGCGLCCDASDAEALAALFREYINDKEKYAKCGVAGREYFQKHFSQEIHFKMLETQLEALIR